MTIGGGIALIAIGAVLTFALSEQQIGPLNVAVVGIILMAAGLIGLIFGLVQQRRVTTTSRPVTEERRVVDDRDVY